MNKIKHNEEIIAQFTKTAASYTSVKSHSEALNKLLNITSAGKDDEVLDVACGSGIVTLAFANKVKHVTGIDITPTMLNEAAKSQKESGLTNIAWMLGEADALPFGNDEFSIVISRFSFHHFISPEKVLSEMMRVCKPGGTVMVADVAISKSKSSSYDEMEKLRDPSHFAVLSPEILEELFVNAGLKDIRSDSYQMEITLQEQLDASCAIDSGKLKKMILEDLGNDHLGVNATQTVNGISMYYPIYIFAGNK